MPFDQNKPPTLFGAMLENLGPMLLALALLFFFANAIGTPAGLNIMGAGLVVFFILMWAAQAYPKYRENLSDFADAKGARDFSEFRKLPRIADFLKQHGKNAPTDRLGIPQMDDNTGRAYDGHINGIRRGPFLLSVVFFVGLVLLFFGSSWLDSHALPFFTPGIIVVGLVCAAIIIIKTIQQRSNNHASYEFFFKPLTYPFIRARQPELSAGELLEDRLVFKLGNYPKATFCLGVERRDVYVKVLVPSSGADTTSAGNVSRLPTDFGALLNRINNLASLHGISESEWLSIERKYDTLTATLFFEANDDTKPDELGIPKKIVEFMESVGTALSVHYQP